ncbi:MAG: Com family DNA-binding transcriptional regulator [Achromobacter veterisilvae]
MQAARLARAASPVDGRAKATKSVKVLQPMKEVRCGNCRRKLAEGVYIVLAIKCPRCGHMNNLKAVEPPSATRAHSGGQHGNQEISKTGARP